MFRIRLLNWIFFTFTLQLQQLPGKPSQTDGQIVPKICPLVKISNIDKYRSHVWSYYLVAPEHVSPVQNVFSLPRTTWETLDPLPRRDLVSSVQEHCPGGGGAAV